MLVSSCSVWLPSKFVLLSENNFREDLLRDCSTLRGYLFEGFRHSFNFRGCFVEKGILMGLELKKCWFYFYLRGVLMALVLKIIFSRVAFSMARV